MRLLVALIFFANASLGAKAQLEYVDITLKATNLGVNFTRMAVEVRDHLTRSARLKQFTDELDGLLADIAETKGGVSEVKQLVVYSDLQRRSKANLLRLSSFLENCSEEELVDFCQRELSELMNSARAVSAEARVLAPTALSIAIVASAQEMDLLLADVSRDAKRRNVVLSEYEAHWDVLLSDETNTSLRARLKTLEYQQSKSISDGFGVEYAGGPVVNESEFLEFKEWVDKFGGTALSMNGSSKCIVFHETIVGTFTRAVTEVDTIKTGKRVKRFDPVYTAKVHLDGTGNNNPEVFQSPGITTFEFHFDGDVRTIDYSDRAAFENSMSVFTRRRCRLFEGHPSAMDKRILEDIGGVLAPLEAAINSPVAKMVMLRNEIELAEAASSRLTSAEY